ncbi:MAG: hypothetical protein K9H26_17015 [Prolixibacteraceae bacterium]|nr:hypothetical protein [Prolixibacteraceae bacterium]
MLIFETTLYAQEVELSAIYSNSSVENYQKAVGAGVGYFHFIRNSRLGISVQSHFNSFPYDDIYSLFTGETSYLIMEYRPENVRLAVQLSYAYPVVSRPKSALYLGCNAGMNYFFMKGSYIPYTDGIALDTVKDYEKSFTHRFGMGMFLEYELKGILSDRISSSIRINPEVTGFEGMFMCGSRYPGLVGWLNFQWIIKYNWMK